MYRILELNPQLKDFAGDIDLRMRLYQDTQNRILSKGQSLSDFASGAEYFGFHHVDGGWYYRAVLKRRIQQLGSHLPSPDPHWQRQLGDFSAR